MDPFVAPLQAGMCDASMSMADYLRNFQFIEAVTCQYASTVGFFVLGLLVYGAVGASIYIRTGSVIIPFALLLLTGGAVIGQVASPAIGVMTLVILVAGAGVLTYLYAGYSR